MNLGDLAKRILELKKTRAYDAYDSFKNCEKGKLLRRLHHLAYEGSPAYRHFPISISQLTDKKAVTSTRKIWGNTPVNVLHVYTELKAFFESQGFETKISHQKVRKSLFSTEIKIVGVMQ